MLDTVKRDILPTLCTMMEDLSRTVNAKKSAAPAASCRYEVATIEKLSALCDEIHAQADILEENVKAAVNPDAEKYAAAARDMLIPVMESLRKLCDEAETLCPEKLLPYPVYEELLYSVR